MKNTILFISFFAFLTFFSFGQLKSKKTSVQWGLEEKESKKSRLDDIVGFDNSGIYVIKRKDRSSIIIDRSSIRTLEHFDNKMNKGKTLGLILKQNKKSMDFNFIIHLKNKMYIFSSFKNQELKQNFLFVQTINKKTLLLNNDLKKIAEINYEGKSKRNSGNFTYEVSRDSSKFLIYYNLPYEKNANEKFGFHVFDSSLNELWKKEVTVPYVQKLFGVQDYEVDNHGNVHLLGMIVKEKRHGEPNHRFQILSYYKNGNQFKEYPVNIEGKYLTDMQIAINDEQDIICGGFYSSEGTFSIKGCYFLKINSQSKEIVTKSFKEFELDFITQNMSKRQEKKTNKKAKKGKNVEMYKYNLDNIILRDDGGAILIGEQYFVRVVTTTTTDSKGNKSTRTTYTYYYNDIIIVNISPKGNIDWAKKIAKRQATVNDGGISSSYALSVVKDKLFFIFNDNPNNLFHKPGERLYNFNNRFKESLVVLVEVDSYGRQKKEALFSSKEANVIIRPKVCKQIKNNEMVLFGKKNKTYRFAKVSFK